MSDFGHPAVFRLWSSTLILLFCLFALYVAETQLDRKTKSLCSPFALFFIKKMTVIVRVKVWFRKTAVVDYLSSIHRPSQMKSHRQMMVFMSLVLVLIGQFCRDVIGRQNVKVVVIGRLLLLLFSIRLLFVCRFRLRSSRL